MVFTYRSVNSGRVAATRSAYRSLTVLLCLVASGNAWALSPQNRARLYQACELPLKDAPADIKADVCACYVGTLERRYPNIETIQKEEYARIRDSVRRVIPDCFAEAIAKRDPSVNSHRGWPEAYRAAVLKACRNAAAKVGARADTATMFCDCTSRETEKRFPDSLSAEKYSRHLLAGTLTAADEKASEAIASSCLAQAPAESQEVATVEYLIIRNMRNGMTRANAARRVLRGFSGYYLAVTEARKDIGITAPNADIEQTKGLIAEAGRLYVEACSKCAGPSACERDRVEALMPGTKDRLSPCGEAKAPGEQPPPPMSKEERDALNKDAAPFVASMARGMLMGLVRARNEGTEVSAQDIREARQSYQQLCERCTTRKACESDVRLIFAGRAPEKRPWGRAVPR